MRHLAFIFNALYVTKGLLGQAASHSKIFEIDCRVWSWSYDRSRKVTVHHGLDENFSPVIANDILIPPYVDHRFAVAFRIDELHPWMIGRLQFEMNSFIGVHLESEPSPEEWARGTELNVGRYVLARWIDMAHTAVDQRIVPIVCPVVIEGRVC